MEHQPRFVEGRALIPTQAQAALSHIRRFSKLIQLAALRTTAWTALQSGSYHCRMSRRRQDYDPLADQVHPHWLEIRDAQGEVLEYTALAVGSDLRSVMADNIAWLTADGWHTEGDARRSSFFCTRGDARCFVQLRPTDPAMSAYGPSQFR